MNAQPIDAAEDASDSEVVRYEKAFRETRRAVDEAIKRLAIAEEFETNSVRRDQIAQKRLDLEHQRTELTRANIAFHAQKATMVPPSASLVAEIASISKQAVELTIEKTSAAAALRLATSALNKFAEIQKIGDD